MQNTELTEAEIELLQDKAQFVRLETLRLISIAKVGHYSSVFSCAEIFASLYYDVMSIRRGEPGWPDRDRFLMGKGHAAVGLFRSLPTWTSSINPGSTITRASGARWATIPTCARCPGSISVPYPSVTRCRTASA